MNDDGLEQFDELLRSLDEPEAEFEIKCKKCGSTEVEIEDSRGCGSSNTGPFGSVDLACKNCGASKLLIDT